MVVLLHVTEPAQATLAAQVLGAQPASGPASLALDFVFQRQPIKLFPLKVFFILLCCEERLCVGGICWENQSPGQGGPPPQGPWAKGSCCPTSGLQRGCHSNPSVHGPYSEGGAPLYRGEN